jgi:hypothetical protein
LQVLGKPAQRQPATVFAVPNLQPGTWNLIWLFARPAVSGPSRRAS